MFFLLVILIIQVVGGVWYFLSLRETNEKMSNITKDIKKGGEKHENIISRISSSSNKKDDILMKNQKYLNTRIAELTKEINELSLTVMEDSNEMGNIKDSIASIPKVRQTGLHLISMRDEIIMFTDHFTFDEEGDLVFHMARTNLTEGFLGDLGNIEIDPSNNKCRDIIKCNSDSCNNLKGNYWLNFQTDGGMNDFCKSCVIIENENEDDEDSSTTKLKNSCSLYLASNGYSDYKRFYDAYYDFKNVLDSMDFDMFQRSFSEDKNRYFESFSYILSNEKRVELRHSHNIDFRYIGINHDIENLIILAYHLKKIGKSIPHLKL
jgi:hypothetical protein